MEAYLAKVQSSTEVNHPGVYPAFVQMLMEAGEAPLVNQSELHSKVKVLFKDYPELLREFESFLDPSLDEPTVVNVAGNENSTKVSSHDETIAEMDFLQKIEVTAKEVRQDKIPATELSCNVSISIDFRNQLLNLF